MGHYMRLPPETPAQQALNEILRSVKKKKPSGRPATTSVGEFIGFKGLMTCVNKLQFLFLNSVGINSTH